MAKRDKNNLRVLRAEKRITQIDAAMKASRILASKGKSLGVTRFWRIENGYTDPEPVERTAIARALGVDVAEAFPEAVSA